MLLLSACQTAQFTSNEVINYHLTFKKFEKLKHFNYLYQEVFKENVVHRKYLSIFDNIKASFVQMLLYSTMNTIMYFGTLLIILISFRIYSL